MSPTPEEWNSILWLKEAVTQGRADDHRWVERVLADFRLAQDERFIAAEKAVNAAMAAAERATNKAEQAQIAHNQLTNEFRSQLSDQAATFMPRAEFELAHVSLEKLVSVNTAALSARIDSVDAKLDQEAARRAGGTSTMVTVFAIVGAIGVLVGIIGAVLGFTHL